MSHLLRRNYLNASEKAMKIFIPFIDGTLSYNCRRCWKACCGCGILALTPSESTMIFKERPFLKYFTLNSNGILANVSKLSRCWFLSSNGLCTIEKRFGHDNKPLLCRTFPFRLVRCGKEHFIQLSMLCPTLVVSPLRKEKYHKSIIKNAIEMTREVGATREVRIQPSRLVLEKRVFRRSIKHLNNPCYLNYLADQMRITQNKTHQEESMTLMPKLHDWLGFLKMKKLDLCNAKISYELTAITSVLRLMSLRLSETSLIDNLAALYIFMLLYDKIKAHPKRPTPIFTYVLAFDMAGSLARLSNNTQVKRKLISFLLSRGVKIADHGKNIFELADKYLPDIEHRIEFLHHLESPSVNVESWFLT